MAKLQSATSWGKTRFLIKLNSGIAANTIKWHWNAIRLSWRLILKYRVNEASNYKTFIEKNKINLWKIHSHLGTVFLWKMEGKGSFR